MSNKIRKQHVPTSRTGKKVEKITLPSGNVIRPSVVEELSDLLLMSSLHTDNRYYISLVNNKLISGPEINMAMTWAKIRLVLRGTFMVSPRSGRVIRKHMVLAFVKGKNVELLVEERYEAEEILALAVSKARARHEEAHKALHKTVQGWALPSAKAQRDREAMAREAS